MSMLNTEQAGGSDARGHGLLADAHSAAGASRDRVATAIAELGSPHDRRAGDATRAAMNRLLAGLVAAVEDDLRQRLIEALAARAPAMLLDTLAATNVAIAAPILGHAHVLGDAELIATLLRRVEEQRLVAALPPAVSDAGLLDAFLEGDDAPLAAAAMALIVAERRRADTLDKSLLARTDLPAAQRQTLLWGVAAALSHYMLARAALPAAVVDRAMIAAVGDALAAYDEGDTVEDGAMHLARRLQRRGLLGDTLLRRAFEEGRLALATAIAAVRAGIDYAAAWEMTVDTGGSRLLVLLRGVGVARRDVAVISALLGAAAGVAEDEIDARMVAFDRLDPGSARDAIRPWQYETGYGRALADLAAGLGGKARR